MKKENFDSIFIFRFDLRLQDNIGLTQALKNSHQVIPVYIKENLDLFKVSNSNNKQFILESLQDLDASLNKFGSKLTILESIKELDKILNSVKNLKTIFINKLYHPLHLKQEQELQKLCKKHKIELSLHQDHLLLNPEKVKPSGNKNLAYKVFSPFFNKAKKQTIAQPTKLHAKNFAHAKISNSTELKTLFKEIKLNKNLHKHGGSKNALKILQNLEKFRNYNKTKDFPSIDGTTKLSAYINAGCISCRQVLYVISKTLGKNHELIRQLFWREFYYQLYLAYPELFTKTLKNRKFNWKYDKKILQKWEQGKTGIPIIDASMKELNVTGFMNNRCRMVVSNFLTMKLKIDWKLGEKYFAQKLTDYDPILNNGNWQYMAQVGADTAGYLRILNPERQAKKFDSKKVFVNKWINFD